MIESGNYQLQPQYDEIATKAPKIHTETCEINFDQDTASVFNFIRGLSPFPVAWTSLEGQKLKIYKAGKEIADHAQEPGQWLSDNKSYLKCTTQDGYIHALDLQLQGRKRMEVKAFLNGYDFTSHT